MNNDASQNKKYILVAEDDRFYADIYKAKLEKEGFEVQIADNGEKALFSLKKRLPDLLLLDLIMPVKDGFTVLLELRSDPKLKNLKVVVVSNLGEEEDIKKIKHLGVSDYIVKANMSIQEVIRKIKNYIEEDNNL